MYKLLRFSIVLVLITVSINPFILQKAEAAPFNTGLRFYGVDPGENDTNRVVIPLDNPETAADIGDTDFTIEFRMKDNGSDNDASTNCDSDLDSWINGNIIVDRDIWLTPDLGDFGISLINDKLAFGVRRINEGVTACSSISVADDKWHHIAVTRKFSNGELKIFVDGALAGTADGPDGDITYTDNRSGLTDDPYLVIGAEKHDADPEAYPSYNGILDEFRVSNVLRYTTSFNAPASPFSVDANTLLLYHFDEGSGTTAIDETGNVNGTLMVGGTPSGPEYVSSDPATPTGSPVYRFFNNQSKFHLFTISTNERNKILNNPGDWILEGTAYNAFKTQQAGTSPLYRFLNKSNGSYFFTISENEKNKLINTLSHIYQLEGIAYYSYKNNPGSGGIKTIYRFFNNSTKSHLFTASTTERDKIINTLSHIYVYEGAAFYALK